MGDIIFCSEEYGEVDIEDIPHSIPEKELQSFLEKIKEVMDLPNLRMQYIKSETAKQYCPQLTKIGQIGWGSEDKQLICVIESDDGLLITKKLMVHEVVHVLGVVHELDDKKFDEEHERLRNKIFVSASNTLV